MIVGYEESPALSLLNVSVKAFRKDARISPFYSDYVGKSECYAVQNCIVS